MIAEKVMGTRDVQELELRMASWLLGGRDNIETPGFLVGQLGGCWCHPLRKKAEDNSERFFMGS